MIKNKTLAFLSQFEDLSENLVPAAPHTIDQPMHVGTPLQVDGKQTTESFRKMQKVLCLYLCLHTHIE